MEGFEMEGLADTVDELARTRTREELRAELAAGGDEPRRIVPTDTEPPAVEV